MTTANDWRNLIVAHEPANPLELKAHPLNFYTHPLAQRKVVNAAIDDIGYIDEVVVNRRTGRTLNGHLRVELAIGNGETQIPVTWVDCDEETESQILLFFDRIGEQAKVQGDKVSALADLVAPADGGLQNMLDEWVVSFEKFSRPKPTASVAQALVAAPAALTPAPASAPVLTAAPAQEALAAPIVAETPPEPVVEASAEVVAQEALAAPVVAEPPAEPAVEAPAAAVAQEAPAALVAAEVPAEPAVEASAAVATPVAAPQPANNFEAAIIEDTGAPIVSPPSARAAKVEKPPVVIVKVGEYAQELPEELFTAWWAAFRAEVGDDWSAITTEIRSRLQMPNDPR
ncbi:hypothetical protein K2Z83_26845 [Oscillochloris sp. ZM17-4]|uniref:hypothetical protein n=1 Tax=Oscillochloris sp. ZM17-4 TaxID=2866714 RepID=UPI001C7309A1|nr:hypothetical protein [Oscillochloris sp. ZM17-4]MBX0331272.1 hypothetical protein [Oscillochloris sp. ZM17-4]